MRTVTVAAPGGVLTQTASRLAELRRNHPRWCARQFASNPASSNWPNNGTIFNNLFREIQTMVDPGDPINHICECANLKPLHLIKVHGDTVVPNNSTDRLITAGGIEARSTRWARTQSAPVMAFIVAFTAGSHGSLFDPTASLAATVEMQRQSVLFAVSAVQPGGPFVVITDPTVIQPKSPELSRPGERRAGSNARPSFLGLSPAGTVPLVTIRYNPRSSPPIRAMGLFNFRSKKADDATPEPAEKSPGFIARLRAKLNRGDSWLTYDLANLLPGGKIDDAVLDEIETRLIGADVGIETTEKVVGSLRGQVARKELGNLESLLGALRRSMLGIVGPVSQPLVVDGSKQPFVILVVGVNGSGKTTTIGKLARRLTSEGHKVVLAAGDTFRAAAIEQLQIWGERNSVPVIAQGAGADPAAVIFDALQSAQARGADVLIADTAGRLHTQSNLMEELKKVKRVLGRLDPSAPHEVLLVLDAGQGQNALAQAQQFHQALGVTGLVLTKLDGTAKGGIVLAIADRLKIPLRFVGVGEIAEDFGVFDAETFVDAVLAPPRRGNEAA